MENHALPDAALEDPSSPVNQTLIKKLSEIDDRYLSVEKEWLQARNELQKKYDAKRQEYLLRRKYLLTTKTSTGHWTDRPDTGTPSLPGFWCQVLQHFSQTGAEIVQKWDTPVLQFLTDVTSEASMLSANGFKLVFHFSENPFFSNTEVVLEYLASEGSSWDSGALVCDRISCTRLEWKNGKDVTLHSDVAQEGIDSEKPEGEQQDPRRRSFFRSFLVSLDESLDAEALENIHLELPKYVLQRKSERVGFVEEMMDVHYQIGADIKHHVVPFAVRWYTGEGVPAHPDDDDEMADQSSDSNDGIVQANESSLSTDKNEEMDISSYTPENGEDRNELSRPKGKGKGPKGKRKGKSLLSPGRDTDEPAQPKSSVECQNIEKEDSPKDGESTLLALSKSKGKGKDCSSNDEKIGGPVQPKSKDREKSDSPQDAEADEIEHPNGTGIGKEVISHGDELFQAKGKGHEKENAEIELSNEQLTQSDCTGEGKGPKGKRNGKNRLSPSRDTEELAQAKSSSECQNTDKGDSPKDGESTLPALPKSKGKGKDCSSNDEKIGGPVQPKSKDREKSDSPPDAEAEGIVHPNGIGIGKDVISHNDELVQPKGERQEQKSSEMELSNEQLTQRDHIVEAEDVVLSFDRVDKSSPEGSPESSQTLAASDVKNEKPNFVKSKLRNSRDQVLNEGERKKSFTRPRGKTTDSVVPEEESTPRIRGKGKGKAAFSNDIQDFESPVKSQGQGTDVSNEGLAHRNDSRDEELLQDRAEQPLRVTVDEKRLSVGEENIETSSTSSMKRASESNLMPGELPKKDCKQQ